MMSLLENSLNRLFFVLILEALLVVVIVDSFSSERELFADNKKGLWHRWQAVFLTIKYVECKRSFLCTLNRYYSVFLCCV